MDNATIIETDTSAIQPDVAQDTATVVEQPTVVDQATPMDSNTTYQNLPSDQITIDPNKDFTQNLIQDTIQIANDQAVVANAGQAMNRFLTQEYNYDPNEAGTYWVAGAINDKETQMMFLNTIINEEMYDEMDLNKYYYDTTMATARAYAAQKEKETAYGFYRAAQEKAIAEAQLTGWYMPAEGQYMLMNYEAAQAKLQDPDATPEEIAKAQRISGTTEQWFNANKIGPKGMKCLSMMNYEENVRHNTIMGELQKEANKIAASQAGASAASARLQMRELKFQLEEYELQSGHNITKEIGLDNDNTIGHNVERDYAKYQALEGYHGATTGEAITQLLTHDPDNYAAILMAKNKTWIDNVLTTNGKDPEKFYAKYQASLGDKGLKQSFEDNKNILDESYLNGEKRNFANGEDASGQLYTFHSTENGEAVTRCYYKDSNGVYHQITDGDMKLDNGQTVSEFVHNFSDKGLYYNDERINVGSKLNYNEMPGSVSDTRQQDFYSMDSKTYKNMASEESKGRRMAKGIISVEKQNTAFVSIDDEGKYREVNADGIKDIQKQSNILDVHIYKNGDWEIKHADGSDLTTWQSAQGNQNDYMRLALKQSEFIGDYYTQSPLDINGDGSAPQIQHKVYAYTNSDGSVVYWSMDADGTLNMCDDPSKIKGFAYNSDNAINIENNMTNYSNGYFETKKGLNQNEMEAKAKQDYEDNKTDLDLGNVDSTSSISPTRDATYDAQSTEVKEANYDKVDQKDEGSELLEAIGQHEKKKTYKTGEFKPIKIEGGNKNG